MSDPVDSVWSFAAHIFDKIPSGSLIGFLLAGAAVFGLYKAAPVLLRALQSSTEAIGSSAAAFESMEAHVTAALSRINGSLSKIGPYLREMNARLSELEKKMERALRNKQDD